ncbi:HEAT repeat domain-containing protein [Nannocystaceae bacterium ST9]
MTLWLGVVAANLFGLFAAVWIAGALRLGAGNPNTLLPIYYVLMLVAGLADGLWLDEVLFKGGFRRSVLQGMGGQLRTKASAKVDDKDIEDVAATLQRPTLGFPVVVVVCSLLTYGMFNLANHGFDRWWRDIGKQAQIVRHGASVEARIEAIRSLSLRNRPEVLDIFEAALTDPEPRVAAWAAWGLGRQRQNSTMNANRIAPLYDQVRKGPPEVRHEALIALARLQHQPIADEVAEELRLALEGSEPVDVRLVWALGYVQHPDTLPVLDQALYHADPRVRRIAAWALAQQRDSGKGREAADLLEQRLPAAPFETKCAIVHALGVLTDERSNLALIHAYQGMSESERETLCTSESIYAAPDFEDDREDILMPQDTYAMKTLHAMGGMRATTAQIRAEVEPWLETLIADEQTTHVFRESAQSLLAGIRDQRNDRAAKPAK